MQTKMLKYKNADRRQKKWDKEVEAKEETVNKCFYLFNYIIDHASIHFFFYINSLHCFVWFPLYQLLHLLKETQTESYKYCIIIAGNNPKISKTPRLLNKLLLSLSVPFSLLTVTCTSLAFLNSSFFSSWTEYSTNFKCHMWSFMSYIVSFSDLKMAFSKLSMAKYHCLHKKTVHYFMSSITTEHLCKSFSFVNSSVQIFLKLN